MYLISLYFDEKTDKRIREYIKQVAKRTGNTFMLDGNVPPHITIAAFESQNLEEVIAKLDVAFKNIKAGKLTWASVGTFFPHVIFLAPVLNSALHHLAEVIHDALKNLPDIRLRPNYQPFNWMPHTTIAKKLSSEEMRIAFEVLQSSFGMFEGEAVKIGLAKTNPYEDIKVWKLGGEGE